jgi:hypothetical protein
VSAALEQEGAAGCSERVSRELWTSFVSLLRSYTAAHGLNGPRQAVLEVSEGDLLIRAGDRRLRVTFDGSGGQWQREQGPPTDFTMDDQGRVVTNGAAEEMDMAAEALAREIMR